MSTLSGARIGLGSLSSWLPGHALMLTRDPIRPSGPAARARRSAIGLGVVALGIVMMAGSTPARATSDFDEVFEEMDTGDLNGQAGWSCTPNTISVVHGPGIDTTQVTNGAQGQPVAEADRFLPVAFHYTTVDTAIVWSCWAFAGPGGCNKDALAGPSGHTTQDGCVFGLDVVGGHSPTTYLSCVGTRVGDALAFAHWYEIRVVANFAVSGGVATLSYRDLTLGQETFTVDGTLRDVSLGQSTDVDGSYPFQQAYVRVDDQCIGGCFVDHLHIGAPGSSTAAVLPGAPVARWALSVSPDPARVRRSVVVRFSLAERSPVKITAFDTSGRRVGTLVDEALNAGAHERRWDLSRDAGERLGAGVYFVRLEASGHVVSSKLEILR